MLGPDWLDPDPSRKPPMWLHIAAFCILTCRLSIDHQGRNSIQRSRYADDTTCISLWGAGLHREYRQVSLSPNMDHGLGQEIQIFLSRHQLGQLVKKIETFYHREKKTKSIYKRQFCQFNIIRIRLQDVANSDPESSVPRPRNWLTKKCEFLLQYFKNF